MISLAVKYEVSFTIEQAHDFNTMIQYSTITLGATLGDIFTKYLLLPE